MDFSQVLITLNLRNFYICYNYRSVLNSFSSVLSSTNLGECFFNTLLNVWMFGVPNLRHVERVSPIIARRRAFIAPTKFRPPRRTEKHCQVTPSCGCSWRRCTCRRSSRQFNIAFVPPPPFLPLSVSLSSSLSLAASCLVSSVIQIFDSQIAAFVRACSLKSRQSRNFASDVIHASNLDGCSVIS